MEKKSKPIIIVGILVVLAMLGVLIASIASKAKSEGGVNHGKSLETLEKKVKINNCHFFEIKKKKKSGY